MTAALLRRDPAVRTLPKWVVVGALFASALAGVRVLLTTLHSADGVATAQFGDALLLALALWIPVALFLAFGNAGQRCNRFDLALPLSAVRLNATHLTGVLLSGSIVLAAATSVVLFHDWLLGKSSAKALTPEPGVGALVFCSATTMVLVAASLLSVRPTVYRIPSGRRWALFVTTVLLGGLGLILVLSVLPLAVSLLPLALAAILTANSFRALPQALSLVPLPGVEDEDHEDEESWAAIERPAAASELSPQQSRLRRLSLDGTLYKILALGIAPTQMLRVPINVISIPFLMGMGLLLSGFVFDNPIRLTNITLTAYMLLAFLAAPMAQLYLLDPLPISRRRLFALVMLPGLLAVALGYGFGRLGISMSEEKPAILFTSQPTRMLGPIYRTPAAMVRVPATQFRVAWDGEVPLNESPWGESHEALSYPLFEGSRALVYSPFSTTAESSVDFTALQISRAVEAVYGRTIPYEEIRERYLEPAPDGGAQLRDASGLTLLKNYPDLHAGGEGPIFPVVMLFTGLLLMAIGALFFRSYRASISEGARKSVFFLLMGAALVLHITPFIAFITGFVEDWVVLGQAEAGVLWLARTLPGGDFAVWVLCTLIFYAGYRPAQASFERIEVPLPRPKQVA